jgi:hypothetical protein
VTSDLKEKKERKTQIDVDVIYAGLTKSFEVVPNQSVESLLDLSLNAFGIQANRHTQSLYSSAGVELADAQNLKDAGIKDGTQLLLRPSQVKGGTDGAAHSRAGER